ncbi:hypothetical protein [Paraglaciecola sp.]|uniref:hypothetical protein n=1 Tax=Paraglaciecola sp. TaxID=1920173 RepID=UPI0030F40B63
MFELAKSEFVRYQKWALLVAIVLLGLLGFVSKIKPLLEASTAQSALVNITFFGLSLILGLLQMALYKRANHWTYLIHRPISPAKIYFALSGAGMLLITVALGLPWLINMLGLDIFTHTVVESRHYLHIIFLLLTCIMCYLIGSLVVLNASYAIAGMLVMLVLVLAPTAKNTLVQFLPLLAMIAGLLYLNVKSFQPDLSRYLTQPLSVILLAIPLCFALSFLLTMTSTLTLYHLPKFIAGTHPDTNPVENTYRYIWEYDVPDSVEYILQNVDTPLARNMVQQAKLAKVDWIDAEPWTFPRKGQLYVDDYQYALAHKETHSMWQFSHGQMVLVGLSNTSGKVLGVMGKNGFKDNLAAVTEADRFEQVPFLLGEKHFMTRSAIYQVNFTEKTLTEKFALNTPEVFIGVPEMHDEYVSVATNRNILLFDPRSYRDEYQQVIPDYIVPHPVPVKSLQGLRAFQLADGFLLTYFGSEHFGFDRPGAQAFYAKLSGEIEYVGGREFTIFSHPEWIRHSLYVLSPVLWGAQNIIYNFIEPENLLSKSLAEIRQLKFPEGVNTLAIILHIVSVLGAIVICRRHRMTPAQMATWISLCIFFSVPALVSCLLLNPLRVEKAARLQPA